MVAAVAADDFKQVRVPSFRPPLNHAGRPAAENHRPAIPGLITGRHTRLLQRRLRWALPEAASLAGLPPGPFVLTSADPAKCRNYVLKPNTSHPHSASPCPDEVPVPPAGPLTSRRRQLEPQ